MRFFKETCRPINKFLKNKQPGMARPSGRLKYKKNNLNQNGIVNPSVPLNKNDHTDIQPHDHRHTRVQLHDHRNVVLQKQVNHDVQWGFIKFSEDQETQINRIDEEVGKATLEKAILFVNNTNLQTITGEEKRTIYYDIKNVDLQLDSHTRVTIHVAYNFDHVSKNPVFPKSHDLSSLEMNH